MEPQNVLATIFFIGFLTMAQHMSSSRAESSN